MDSSKTNQHPAPPQEIDLIDLAKKIWAERCKIIKFGAIGGIVGLIVAFSIPKEYTVTVKMAPEGKNSSSSSNNMAGLAAMAGINMPTQASADAITTALYPEMIESTSFLIELSQIKIASPTIDTTLTLFDYTRHHIKSPWWKHVIGLPGKCVEFVSSIFKKKKEEPIKIDPFRPTPKQEEVLGSIRSRLLAKIDKKSNLIDLSVKLQDPYIAAVVADSAVAKLEDYIKTYRTEKANRDLVYNQLLSDEAKEKYYKAQALDAAYADAMKNISLESVRIERERLTNEKMLAYQVYAQATTRLEMSRAKVQEDTPCVMVLEPASVPNRSSNTSKMMIIVAFVFLAAFVSVGKIVFDELLELQNRD